MKDAGICEVYFGRFDEAFTEVFEPGLELVEHEGSGENVQVVFSGVFFCVEAASEVGGVPESAVEVGDHAPEAS